MSLGAMQNRPNFDLVNSFPKIPVYFKINDEPRWQILKHYQAQVPADGHINLTLSASPDGAHPTYFVFTPTLPKGIVARPRGPMTCFIQVNVGFPSMHVLIAPQNSRNTRFGLSLANNITYPEIGLFQDQATYVAAHCAAAAPGTPSTSSSSCTSSSCCSCASSCSSSCSCNCSTGT